MSGPMGAEPQLESGIDHAPGTVRLSLWWFRLFSCRHLVPILPNPKAGFDRLKRSEFGDHGAC
jgi:hypothetical protein